MKDSLKKLIERGGIYYHVGGSNSEEALTAFISVIPEAGPEIQPGELLKATLEREVLMSTGIGHGIALPHPRNPIAPSADKQFVALAFLDHPVDWSSLDGIFVDTLFLIVSSNPKEHLKTLSRINFFCQQDDFLELLRKKSSRDDILKYIGDTELKW
jgi:PTS system nitrogen regulatory IIA component